MLSAAMMVFGYLGYRQMGISQFPEIDFPVVSITTYREAADPETMDFDVTDIIEDAVSGVEASTTSSRRALKASASPPSFPPEPRHRRGDAGRAKRRQRARRRLRTT